MLSELRFGSLVMIFTTPAIALAPYSALPPPRITSIRSTIPAGNCSKPYTEASDEKIGRESISICVYCPSKPLMRICGTPQLEHVSSTRNPVWKFSTSAIVFEVVDSIMRGETIFTMVATSFCLVSYLLAVTTTLSIKNDISAMLTFISTSVSRERVMLRFSVS